VGAVFAILGLFPLFDLYVDVVVPPSCFRELKHAGSYVACCAKGQAAA